MRRKSSKPRIVYQQNNGRLSYRVVIDSVMILAALGAGVWINESITVLHTQVTQLNADRISDSRIVRIEDHLATLDTNVQDIKQAESRIEANVANVVNSRPQR